MKNYSHWPLAPDDMILRFKTWKNILELKETGFIFFYPYSERSYRIKNFLEWLKDNNIDLPTDVQISPTTDDLSNIINIDNLNKSGYLIDGAEHLLTPDKERLLQELISLSEKSTTPIIFFAEYSLKEYLEYFKKFNKTSYVKNLSNYPLLNKLNSFDFIRYLENKWSFKIPKPMFESIFEETGGYMWLIKEIARQIKSDKKTLNEIILSSAYIWKTEMIWDRFSKVLQNNLVSYYRGQKVDGNIKNDFIETRLLNKEINGSIPNYLKRLLQAKLKSKVEVTNREIIINSVEFGSRFSQFEKRMIILLVNNKDNYISRDQLAKARWGENWTEAYSDWAIDQAIYRLRRKLSGIDKTIIISSSRKQGYAITW